MVRRGLLEVHFIARQAPLVLFRELWQRPTVHIEDNCHFLLRKRIPHYNKGAFSSESNDVD